MAFKPTDLDRGISMSTFGEEVEEDDEDEEPLHKRLKRRSGESASASSPVKETTVGDKEEMSGSSSGASEPVGPFAVPPLSSAAPIGFARMPSVSLGSEDDADVTRLVA